MVPVPPRELNPEPLARKAGALTAEPRYPLLIILTVVFAVLFKSFVFIKKNKMLQEKNLTKITLKQNVMNEKTHFVLFTFFVFFVFMIIFVLKTLAFILFCCVHLITQMYLQIWKILTFEIKSKI